MVGEGWSYHVCCDDFTPPAPQIYVGNLMAGSITDAVLMQV